MLDSAKEPSEKPKTFAERDQQFVAAINTFRPISSREIAGQKPKTVRYVKATSATTFAKLGPALKLNSVDVQDLRIINGFLVSSTLALSGSRGVWRGVAKSWWWLAHFRGLLGS